MPQKRKLPGATNGTRPASSAPPAASDWTAPYVASTREVSIARPATVGNWDLRGTDLGEEQEHSIPTLGFSWRQS